MDTGWATVELAVEAMHRAAFAISCKSPGTTLNDGGPVFGVFPEERYAQSDVQLQRGDALVLFTDGVTEVRNDDGEEFGEERLEQLLMSRKFSAAELREQVMSAITEFGGGNFEDDVTLLVLKVR
jgi:sigma-B regulation protein RsbU (phosphoserine phosphatase)